jgi:hypothetical protein
MTGDAREAALDAFALLAAADRLRVAAALILGAGTTEDVAAAAGLSSRDALAALTKLEAGELVGREAGRWVFDVRRLASLARDARPKPLPDDVGDAAPDAARVLQRFLRDGRVLSIPVQRARRLIVLDHIAMVFEIGVRYPERDVNVMLRAFHDDVATLRRYLVDEHFLSRGAGVYWRSGGSVHLPEPPP